MSIERGAGGALPVERRAADRHGAAAGARLAGEEDLAADRLPQHLPRPGPAGPGDRVAAAGVWVGPPGGKPPAADRLADMAADHAGEARGREVDGGALPGLAQPPRAVAAEHDEAEVAAEGPELEAHGVAVDELDVVRRLERLDPGAVDLEGELRVGAHAEAVEGILQRRRKLGREADAAGLQNPD